MNTVKIAKVGLWANDIEPMAIGKTAKESTTELPPAALSSHGPKSKREAVVRYAMLALIALSLGWLGFYVLQSINELNSQIEQIHANIVTKGSLGPD